MASRTVASDGSLPLGQFETIVQQQEGIFGPLLALSSLGAQNLITLTVGPRPEHRARLEIIAAEPAPAKPGHDLICTGDVFVLGQPVLIAAYRAAGD